MPSWPTRLFLGSSATTPSTLPTTTNEPLTPLRSPPSQATSSSVPRAASQHGRSFSHPFPSIFGSGKKKTSRDEDDDDDDVDVVDAKTHYATQPREATAQGQPKANLDYQRSPTSRNFVTLGRKQSSPPSPSRPSPTPPPISSDVSKDLSMPIISRSRGDSSKAIFRTLENYILACFDGVECLNASFSLAKPPMSSRAKSEGSMVPTVQSSEQGQKVDLNAVLSPVDAKTLLLGDFAENGMWWTGGTKTERSRSHRAAAQSPDRMTVDRIYMRSQLINFKELDEWYHCIINVGRCSNDIVERIKSKVSNLSELEILRIEEDLQDASMRVQKTLIKAVESLLRRPGRPLKAAADCRFLLVLLVNPMLYPPNRNHIADHDHARPINRDQKPPLSKASGASINLSSGGSPSNRTKSSSTAACSSITKRILGLLSTLSADCHHHLISCFSQFPKLHFQRMVELVGSFVTYRLSRQHNRKVNHTQNPNGDLVPSLSGSGIGTSAQLHAALGISTSKTPDQKSSSMAYGEDWQIRAAAKVMSLLFSANNSGRFRRQSFFLDPSEQEPRASKTIANQRASRYDQLLPTNAFYNSFLDCLDLVTDFETWESRRGKFSFCQYPMFLSIWAKIHIMEYDARRQMEIKAREAFFDSIMNRKAVSQYLVLKVRRDCLVEDSLRGVSEVVGTGQEDIKKGLRIEFASEEGVDAGG
ncbi:MAG: hypothetical protein Q9195_000694 [Heterodermia aff. obscurata]